MTGVVDAGSPRFDAPLPARPVLVLKAAGDGLLAIALLVFRHRPIPHPPAALQLDRAPATTRLVSGPSQSWWAYSLEYSSGWMGACSYLPDRFLEKACTIAVFVLNNIFADSVALKQPTPTLGDGVVRALQQHVTY